MASDTSFRQWMRKVDSEIRRITENMVGMYDLGDYLYRDAFEDGESAEVVARDVLDDNGFPSE